MTSSSLRLGALIALVLAQEVLAVESVRAASAMLERELLTPQSTEGCEGIRVSGAERELWSDAERSVDVAGRYWRLERPSVFEHDRSVRSYRVGAGSLEVVSELSDDHRTETLAMRIAAPIEPRVLRRYLPDVALPCTRTVRYEMRALPAAQGDLESLAAFDDSLHRAAELVYDERFAEARSALEVARRLRPEMPAPYWMLARLSFLELEEDAETRSAEQRVATYERARELADAAIERAPEKAEGYLWRGIALGRRATARGNLRVAFAGMVGDDGPKEIEVALRRATDLVYDYAFFGASTRADAFYALAQYYRLAPDGWYMRFMGTRGDRVRAADLAREAALLEPGRIDYALEVAVSSLCRAQPGDVEFARRELDRLIALPALSELDRIDQAHARALEESVPDNICWYSRDGFQESIR